MGFLTEMFSRPRPQKIGRTRAIDAVTQIVRETSRSDFDIRPADFPRLSRVTAQR